MKSKARVLINRKVVLDDGRMIQAVVWEVPEPLPGSTHHYKYRFYYGKYGRAIVRYDNERGKGDHRHYPSGEEPYAFINIEVLYRDFLADVERYENLRRG